MKKGRLIKGLIVRHSNGLHANVIMVRRSEVEILFVNGLQETVPRNQLAYIDCEYNDLVYLDYEQKKRKAAISKRVS